MNELLQMFTLTSRDVLDIALTALVLVALIAWGMHVAHGKRSS